MLHYSCDVCKRPIDSKAGSRHVVKIEVFPAIEDGQSCGCEGDGESDADHLEEMQDLLERLDSDEVTLDDATQSMRFDLCDACRQRFVKNPLGVKSGKQLDFSQN
jgi:hypothetical protein